MLTVDWRMSIRYEYRSIRAGVDKVRSGLAVPRHRHRAGYANVLLSGSFAESAAMVGIQGSAKSIANLQRETYFLEFAKRARFLFRKPVMLTGGLRSHSAICAALSSSAIDVIGLARPMILDPNLPQNFLRGEVDPEGFHHSAPQLPFIRHGMFGGLAEIGWHTVQLWRLSRGLRPDTGLGAVKSTMYYLSTQTRQEWDRKRSLKSAVDVGALK
jgi:hypothetical protein